MKECKDMHVLITTIAKDLEYTSKFYNALLEIKPIHSEGIDLMEQIVRFLKYYNNIKEGENINRILLGFNKDYKNRELLINLHKKNIITISKNSILDMPVFDMDNKTIKYMAIQFFPNDIMQYFIQIQSNTI